MNNQLNNYTAFADFVKRGKTSTARSTNNCVIYTRVSSKEQAENNTSLESQKRYCEEFCKRKGFVVTHYFGGTYESAQKDERKEFVRMMDYVKKDKQIEWIVVYSYDRFSRSGANAVYLTNELTKIGIRLVAVSQEVDTSTPAGKFQKDIFLLFSQFDNDLRRDKTVKGMIENLRQGYWVAMTPFGYTNLNKKEKAKNHRYVVNKDGELLQIAFKLKAEGKLSNKEIVTYIQKRGCTITYKNFNALISNIFYCGLITHKMIPGEVFKGRHPPLVTEELFLKANEVKESSIRLGIKKKQAIEGLPLKVFVKDENTLAPFTGFKQKGIYYYKGRHICGATVNANHLHELFIEALKKFEFKKDQAPILREKILQVLFEKLKGQFQDQTLIKKQISELIKKVENLERKYIEENMEKRLYEKFLKIYQTDRVELEQKLTSHPVNSSNLEKSVLKGLKMAENISTIWTSSDFHGKQKLQNLVFPDGILFNKKNDTVQTLRTNSLFIEIAVLAKVSDKKESGYSVKSNHLSQRVTALGFKPKTF